MQSWATIHKYANFVNCLPFIYIIGSFIVLLGIGRFSLVWKSNNALETLPVLVICRPVGTGGGGGAGGLRISMYRHLVIIGIE